MISLAPDFKEFLRLLNSGEVEYLLVGGYAVGYYGFLRSTGDIDIWIKADRGNAQRVMNALRAFGFGTPELSMETFLQPDRIIRMGLPPARIEILTGISGVTFDDCFQRRRIDEVDGVLINIISRDDLKANKRAAGRLKDLTDLEGLG